MDLVLEGRRALVTGSSRGLGKAIAASLLSEGAQVAITARSETGLNQAAGSLDSATGMRPLVIRADLTDPDGPAQLVAAAAEQFGGLDIVAANTGGPPRPLGAFLDKEPASWDEAFSTQLMPVVRLLRSSLPVLSSSGRNPVFLAVTSVTVKEAMDHHVQSTVYRAAVHGMCRHVARHYGSHGVRINVIAPASVATGRLLSVIDVSGRLGQVPMGRLGQPSEVGDLVAFLASPRAAFVHGTSTAIDGGYSAGPF